MTIHIPVRLLVGLLLLLLSPLPALVWAIVPVAVAIVVGLPPPPEGTDPYTVYLLGVGMFVGGTGWGWLTAGAVRAEARREAQR